MTKKRIKNTIIQLIVLLLVIIAIRAYQLDGTAKGEAPNIIDRLITGESVDLRQYRGAPVLVHFWATWCPVCKYENSNIDSIAKDYPVISIAHLSESEQSVVEFMHTENLSMPVVADIKGKWGRQYGVRGVPVSFVLDSKGNIKFAEMGYTTEIGLRLRMWWAGK